MIPEADFADLVARLMPTPPPPVWSILVTVFGDLALVPGRSLSGTTLRTLTAPMGLTNEAVRTALHRLRRDGWIVSTRAGRASDHALTNRGRWESRAAAALIYAREAPAKDATLLITDPAVTAPDLPGLQLAPGLLLTSAAIPDAMAVPLPPGTPLPDWIATRLCDADLWDRIDALATSLTATLNRLPILPPPSPTQTVILRVLIVHNWRRIVLRLPPLPDHVFPPNWQGPRCRTLAADLLDRLPVPDLTA